MKRRGFTLMELLTVLAILALLIALLLPVVTIARRRAQMAPCISNLKQIYLAWSLYKEENNDQWAPGIKALVSQGNKAIFRCPDDTHNGLNRRQSLSAGTAISYYYLLDLSPLPEFSQALAEKDPNYGIVVCILHGKIDAMALQPEFLLRAVPLADGVVQRLRLDGSVQHANVPVACFGSASSGIMKSRPHWYLLTDARPCPAPWCPAPEVPCSR
jgi:prepilin-type N-terminal cleavage/methylation domain-containing protein